LPEGGELQNGEVACQSINRVRGISGAVTERSTLGLMLRQKQRRKGERPMRTDTQVNLSDARKREDRLVTLPIETIFDWMHERSGLVAARDFSGVARVVEGKMVAAFGYDHHDEDRCFFHTCIEPRGMNKRLLGAAFDVPFRQWGYEYLYAGIQDTNVRSLKLAASLGFIEFDILPRVYPSECLRFMIMHKSDCRWLDLISECR